MCLLAPLPLLPLALGPPLLPLLPHALSPPLLTLQQRPLVTTQSSHLHIHRRPLLNASCPPTSLPRLASVTTRLWARSCPPTALTTMRMPSTCWSV
ncbi:hypothetical protein B0H10DRAFT_1102567 [Mycena sp. CBHHK59/15]|nr:hypothetical protein B0H10DRAFT_1102567 [Mycena sp. CBHHK59/15]